MNKDEINIILKNFRESAKIIKDESIKAAKIIKDESNLLPKKVTKEIIKVAESALNKIEENNL